MEDRPWRTDHGVASLNSCIYRGHADTHVHMYVQYINTYNRSASQVYMCEAVMIDGMSLL